MSDNPATKDRPDHHTLLSQDQIRRINNVKAAEEYFLSVIHANRNPDTTLAALRTGTDIAIERATEARQWAILAISEEGV